VGRGYKLGVVEVRAAPAFAANEVKPTGQSDIANRSVANFSEKRDMDPLDLRWGKTIPAASPQPSDKRIITLRLTHPRSAASNRRTVLDAGAVNE
jgi:hypothetical protein